MGGARLHHQRLPVAWWGVISNNKLLYLKGLHGVDMKPSTFRVLVTVLDYANPDGSSASPGRKNLAKDSCLSESTVDRALDELVGYGWLRRVSRGGRSGDGAHWAAEYELCTPGSSLHPRQDEAVSSRQMADVKSSTADVKSSNGAGQLVTSDYPPDHETPNHETPDPEPPTARCSVCLDLTPRHELLTNTDNRKSYCLSCYPDADDS